MWRNRIGGALELRRDSVVFWNEMKACALRSDLWGKLSGAVPIDPLQLKPLAGSSDP